MFITDSSAQAAFAKKATAPTTCAESVVPSVRLLSKQEVLAIVGVTYPTLWKMMRDHRFPRSRIVGQKSKWRSDEVEEWLSALPVRALKGDNFEAVT